MNAAVIVLLLLAAFGLWLACDAGRVLCAADDAMEREEGGRS